MGNSAGHKTVTHTRHRRSVIVLIGMRGSGKTSVGRVLAELIGQRAAADLAPFSETFAIGGSWTETFVDADALIARAADLSIAEIFAQQGEPSFRALERHAIQRICAAPPTVISVGGGAVIDEENVRALAGIGSLVWLTAPAEVLWDRVRGDTQSTANRPSLIGKTGLDEIETLLTRRSEVYRRVADVEIDTTGQTPEQIAQHILDRYEDSRIA